MTVGELLTEVADMRPNTYSQKTIVGMLNEVEHAVLSYMKAFVENEGEDFGSLKERRYNEAEQNTVVLLPDERKSVYLFYCMAKIDMLDHETEDYMNDVAMFNAEMEDWKNEWIRQHMPKGTKLKGY